MRLATVLGAALVAIALPLSATAATPCKTAQQLKLRWEDGKGQVYFSASGCALPSACPGTAGTLIAKMPLHVIVRAGGATLFKGDVNTCDDPHRCIARNAGGCKGGDNIRSSDALVKLTYLDKGSSSVMARVRGSMDRPAETEGPVTAEFTDSSSYSAQATYAKCRSKTNGSTVTIVCQ